MAEGEGLLTLPVPETVAALYVVPVAEPPADLVGLARRGVPTICGDRLAERVLEMLDSPLVSIELQLAHEVPAPPMQLLAALGANEAQLQRLGSAEHLALVSAGWAPGWPPAHEWTARALAAALAGALDSDVVDVRIPRVLDVAEIARSLPDDEAHARMADLVFITHSADRHGFWCTTSGLGRFGLPELQTMVVPPQCVRQWSIAMTGIALRLVRTWSDAISVDRDAAFVELPDTLGFTSADVADAYGDENPAEGGAARVRFQLDPATNPSDDSFLTIEPPADWRGSAGEHIVSACASLFGNGQGEIRHIHRTEAMHRAVAEARARLDDIRTRFEAGELGLAAKLMVKYGLPDGDRNEYVWAYVTSWKDPAHLLAAAADDAVSDPAVRAGRPVVVDAPAIIDWAVWVDGEGVVEGHFTEAAIAEQGFESHGYDVE